MAPTTTSGQKLLAQKTFQATNTINNLARRHDAGDKQMKAPIARNLVQENTQMGIRPSARKHLQTSESASEPPPSGDVHKKFANKTCITILLPDKKRKKKRGSGRVEREDADAAVKNAEGVSLAVKTEMMSEQGQGLWAILPNEDGVRAEETETEELMAARDEWMKKMEEEFAARWEAQGLLEMEFSELLRLSELRDRHRFGLRKVAEIRREKMELGEDGSCQGESCS